MLKCTEEALYPLVPVHCVAQQKVLSGAGLSWSCTPMLLQKLCYTAAVCLQLLSGLLLVVLVPCFLQHVSQLWFTYSPHPAGSGQSSGTVQVTTRYQA